jgi:small GTP-binding protein
MPTSKIMKVFLAGEGGVGKTTMVDRYVNGVFNPNTIMTIGTNFAVKRVQLSNGTDLTLQIWDLGGEQRFAFMIPQYIKGAEGGLLVFDTTRFTSYRNLPNWVKIIRDTVPDMPLILVGTKIDLENASLDEEMYRQFAEENNMVGVVLSSSKNGAGVDDAFGRLVSLYELNHDID